TGRTLILTLSLALLAAAVYSRALQCGFVDYDDPDYVRDNTFVNRGLTMSNLGWAFTTSTMGSWNPMVWLSLMADRQFSGPWPRGFHFTNVALHIVNVMLLLVVMRKMTAQEWPSALVAALFAIHPLHVESVAWISERKDVLSGMFWLLA